LVVKSNTITINVYTAPTIPTAPNVLSVSISSDKTAAYTNEEVTITATVTVDSAIPSGYQGVVSLTLYAIDPTGSTKTVGTGDAMIPAGSKTGSNTWKLVFQISGTWRVWAEAPDKAALLPLGGERPR